MDASRLLRPGLLDGVSVLLAGAPAGSASAPAGSLDLPASALSVAPGAPAGSLGAAAAEACAALGARVSALAPADAGEPPEDAAVEARVAAALAEAGAPHVLVLDGAAMFAARGGGRDGLVDSLQAAWSVTRAVATACFIDAGRGGRIVYVAPAADAGECADAARAGLENLARTLSIEWARHAVTAVAIAPSAAAVDGRGRAVAGEVATLVAYLASPAGAYFSGCLLDLRGLPARA